jgi:hypothetical protein
MSLLRYNKCVVNGSIHNMKVIDCDSNQGILVVKCMTQKKKKKKKKKKLETLNCDTIR